MLLYISTKTTEELERISEKLCLTDQMVFEQAIETFNNLNNERLENSIKDVIDGLDNWIEMVAALKDNGLLTEENIIKILNSQIVKSNDSLMIAVLLESLSKPSCIEALNKFIENGTEDEVFDVIAAVNQGFTNKARNTLASKLTDKAITRIREVNSDGILEYLSEERKAEYLANIEGIDSKLNDIIDRADGNWLNMSMLLSSEGLLTEENIIKIINSIPSQLMKDNKKFQYGVIKKGGRSKDYDDVINLLANNNIISRSYRVTDVKSPLLTNKDSDCFKVYYNDVGLLYTLLHMNKARLMNNDDLRRILIENNIANSISSWGYSLYYYQSEGKAEVSFIIQNRNGKIIPIELVNKRLVKAKSLSLLLSKYEIEDSFKITEENFSRKKNVYSVPVYAIFCLNLR